VANSGFTAQAAGTVESFSPVALSSIEIPGYANNVDVSGNFAYVAAGAAGLQVVSVSDPRNPQLVGALDTPGNANDVRVVGTLAYIAGGLSLVPYRGAALTVGGELNKLASNIALGRNWAGVHWRSDGSAGLTLGEAIAMEVLAHLRTTYPEHFPGFRFVAFDGRDVSV
jgi:hypothetical protein